MINRLVGLGHHLVLSSLNNLLMLCFTILIQARNLQSEKLIDLLELMKTHQVEIGPITDDLLTLLAHLPQSSNAQRSIQVLSEAYNRGMFLLSNLMANEC